MLKQYNFLKDIGPSDSDTLEKIIVPDKNAASHTTDYVHTGTLEWYDEKLGKYGEDRSSDFKVACSTDSFPFNFSSWPRKLKIGFVSRKAIVTVHPQLKKAKRLVLHFQPKDSSSTVQLLRKFQDCVGDVLLPYNPESEVKRALCVFMAHRKLFLCLVPEDQEVYNKGMEVILEKELEQRVNIIPYFRV